MNDRSHESSEGAVRNATTIEVGDSRDAQVGSFTVRRALPRPGRRSVGAWCFADLMGPAQVSEESGLDIGPHPHIGLQTVTWLVDGEVLHRDSLGTEQVITPGQLNLMTAGQGVSHAEEATGHYRGTLQGVQLWIAQPEATRNGAPDFVHLAEPPQVELDQASITVLVGQFEGTSSPARHDTALVGLEIELGATTTVPLRGDFEYALVVLEGEVSVEGRALSSATLGYLRAGRDEVAMMTSTRSRVMLLGGVPFEEPILMWWNFVGRTREEIDAAFTSWQAQDDRFGRFYSPLARIPAAAPYWQRLAPR
jgi:redox-sensitive bicupin YhaK (pirin superfamily)